MASIFLSHSSQDDSLASHLEAWLKRSGFDDLFVDHDSLRSGDKWTDALRRESGSCRVVVCLVTSAWLASDECNGEFLAGWYAGKRMIPLLAVSGVDLDDKQKRRLKRVLAEDQGADITQAGAPANLDLDTHSAVADKIKAGLRAAGALSFAQSIAQTADGLKEASGTIRDTLLSAWRTAEDEAHDSTRAQPLGLSREDKLAYLEAIERTRLERLRIALDDAISVLRERAARPDATVLIAMDQGEELARADGESGDAFGDFLKAAMRAEPKEGKPAPFMIAFTVRTDSFQELQTAKRFRGISTRPADIRGLPSFRFGNTIEQPAARYSVEFEPDLVDVLIRDASGSDALPLLAFTLQKLWRQFSIERRIRLENYLAIGKLSGLIEDAAERALCGIDPLAPQGPLGAKVPIGGAPYRTAAHLFLPGLAQVNERGAVIRRLARFGSFDEAELRC